MLSLKQKKSVLLEVYLLPYFAVFGIFSASQLWGAGKWPPANNWAQGVRSRLNKDTETRCHIASTHPGRSRKEGTD